MAHKNEMVVTAAKVEGTTADDVKTSLREFYPDFVVANILDKDTEWHAYLTKDLTDDEVLKIAVFGEEGEENSSKEKSSEPKSSESEGESEPSEPKSEDEGLELPGEPGEGEESEKDQLRDIQTLLKELTTQVQELHSQYQESKGALQEIHDTSKPHVEELPSPDKLGPTAPGGGNPMGLNAPKPSKPGAPPFGGAPSRPRPGGPPLAKVKVAYANVSANGNVFSMNEVIEAMHIKYPDYEVVNITRDPYNSRYVARLERK